MRTIRNAKNELLIATLMKVVFALAASLFFIQGQAMQVYAFADSSVAIKWNFWIGYNY